MRVVEYHIDPETGAQTETSRQIDDGPAVPRILSGTSFNELCFAVLGGGTDLTQITSGMATFQGILDAAEAAGGAAKACVTHYGKSNLFELADVELFFTILVTAGVMENTPAQAVLAAWPTT